jgi:two-component system, OmpR family, response regulator MprA
VAQRILVVDDDPGIRETVEGVLDLEGYEVVLASDGIQALEKIDLQPPSLIILDMMMPRMDGFTLATELERRGLRPILPIIVLTADNRAPQKAAQIGAEGYLEKPFTITGMLDEISRVLGS